MNLHLILFILAVIACPIAYAALCLRMIKVGVPNPPNIPFFFLLGVVGGWMFAICMMPSAIGLICLVILAVPAPIATVSASLYLEKQPERTTYHCIALLGGYAYAALVGIWFIVVFFTNVFTD